MNVVKVCQGTPGNKPLYLGVFINAGNLSQFAHLSGYQMETLSTGGGSKPFLLYFFMLKDIDSKNLTIEGLYFDHTRNNWNKGVFPFPAVVYMRIKPDSSDKRVQTFLDLLANLRIPLVNSLPSFDKWHVYQALSNHSHIALHLPETRLYHKQSDDLTSLLQRYGKVYLKARRGSRGREVMQVSRLHGSRLEYRYFDRKLFYRIIDAKHIYRVIDTFFGGCGLIVQQPIDLLTLQNNKVDLRAEVQRNGQGKLEVIAIPVRVGCPSSPITTHGSSFRFDQFFSGILNYNQSAVEELEQRLHTMLFEIYMAIEKSFGPFGELGIDIGLDKSGHLWFIECNSQSAKVSLTNAYTGPISRKAWINPLSYARLIAVSQADSLSAPR
jgi:hypothetical protein